MCHSIFNTLLSIHCNYCSKDKVSTPSYMSRRNSLPALPIIHHNPEDNIKEAIKKHSTYFTIDDKQVKDMVKVEEEDYDIIGDDMQTRCVCGIELTKGWQCDNCRVNCSDCNRALTKDPQDYCTRCNVKCQKHGLYKFELYESCPLCYEQ